VERQLAVVATADQQAVAWLGRGDPNHLATVDGHHVVAMRFDHAEARTHDYKRHGTTTLFAALEVATGRITADACYPRHRSGEFLAFLKQVAKAGPDRHRQNPMDDALGARAERLRHHLRRPIPGRRDLLRNRRKHR
jgi:hypothetical protein